METNSANQTDQAPNATRTIPVQSGARRDSVASASSAARAGAKNTTTTSGSDSAKPNSPKDTNPEAKDAPVVPAAAAEPRSARISGAAQAGMFNPNSIPKAIEPRRLRNPVRLGPNECISMPARRVRYNRPSAI